MKALTNTLFNGMTWEQVASVSTGGKPHFFVSFPVIEGKRVKYTVAWHRQAQAWIADYDDRLEIGAFTQPHHARLAAWEHMLRLNN